MLWNAKNVIFVWTVIYMHKHVCTREIIRQCNFWICMRLNITSSNTMVMLIWSTPKMFHIWETLSINFHCVWAQRIIDVNTESSSFHPLSAQNDMPDKCNSLSQDAVEQVSVRYTRYILSLYIFYIYLIYIFNYKIYLDPQGQAVGK